MKLIAIVVGSILLLGLAAFCLFGLAATFEPTDSPETSLAFRIGYAVVGVSSILGTIMLLVKGLRK